MTTVAVLVGYDYLRRVNLTIPQGSEVRTGGRYREQLAPGATPTVPADWTDWTARSQIRDTVGGTVWLSSSHLDRISIEADGWFYFTLPGTDTEPTTWDSRDDGVWDLELVAPDGRVIRAMGGDVYVSHDVTRAIP